MIPFAIPWICRLTVRVTVTMTCLNNFVILFHQWFTQIRRNKFNFLTLTTQQIVYLTYKLFFTGTNEKSDETHAKYTHTWREKELSVSTLFQGIFLQASVGSTFDEHASKVEALQLQIWLWSELQWYQQQKPTWEKKTW